MYAHLIAQDDDEKWYKAEMKTYKQTEKERCVKESGGSHFPGAGQRGLALIWPINGSQVLLLFSSKSKVKLMAVCVNKFTTGLVSFECFLFICPESNKSAIIKDAEGKMCQYGTSEHSHFDT